MAFRRTRVGIIVVYRGLVKSVRLYSQIVCPAVTTARGHIAADHIFFLLFNIKVVAKSGLFCKW